jgi:hypothetical protein
MRHVVMVMTLMLAAVAPTSAQTADETALRGLEERFRTAKLKRDIKTLDALYHPDFYSTNQTGNSRNRKEALDLWTWFSVESLDNEISRIQVTGDTAVVSGRTHEVSGTGTEPFQFTRVYVRTPEGWKILSNAQSWSRTGGRIPEILTRVTGGNTQNPPRTVTPSGLTVEEVKVGGSCVIVVSRSTNQQVAVAPCNAAR